MTDTFCSDIVALFWNHIWECDTCYRKCFLTLILLVAFIMLLHTLLHTLIVYFMNKSESLSYKAKYKKLKEDYHALSEELIAVNGLCEALKHKYEETEK